jgi:hypothetical protein
MEKEQKYMCSTRPPLPAIQVKVPQRVKGGGGVITCARKRLRHILVGGKMDIRKREGENNTKGKRIRSVLT